MLIWSNPSHSVWSCSVSISMVVASDCIRFSTPPEPIAAADDEAATVAVAIDGDLFLFFFFFDLLLEAVDDGPSTEPPLLEEDRRKLLSKMTPEMDPRTSHAHLKIWWKSIELSSK